MKIHSPSNYNYYSIGAFSSPNVGILNLRSHPRYACSWAASTDLRHSWRRFCSNSQILEALKSDLHDRNPLCPTVDSGTLFKILSPDVTLSPANRSRHHQQLSLFTSRKDSPLELARLAKCRKLRRTSDALVSFGQTLKRNVQPAIADVAIEQYRIKIQISGIACDTSNNSFSYGGIFSRTGSVATLKKLGPHIRSHTTCWKSQVIEHKAKAQMESSNKSSDQNYNRIPKRLKKNPEEVETLLKLNMCSKHGDLHGALEIFDRVKREGVFHLKQYHYNVLLYICSGAASGNLSKGKCGKDDKNSGIEILHIGKQVKKEDQKLEMVMEMHVEPSSDPACSDLRSSTGTTTGHDDVTFSSQEMELAARRGLEIYEEMLQADVPLSEATFTSVARLACAKGDGDLAFEMVKRMTAAKITPKLRSYVPAVISFCDNNEVQKAFDVDKHMLAAGVLPDENLLEALLKASVEAGLEDKVYSLLHRLRTTVRELSSATVDSIKSWFNSEAAASAGKANWDSLLSKEELKVATDARGGGWHGQGWLGKGAWNVGRTNMNKLGCCLLCREHLCTIDINPQETESFAKSVADLACQREHQSNDFKAFQRWVDEHGPFDAIIDGANIGLFNSLFSRVFNFDQLDAVVKEVRSRSLTNKPPLVVLHRRRTTDETALSGKAQAMFKSWIQENALFTTPHGSNDDWYWLYAAVKCKCLLVTNDEMRDHLFELLGNDFFPKWKERHQVRFTFDSNALELHMPLPYSIVIQESQNGSWHIPQIGGDDITTAREWLCVTRPDPVNVIHASVHNVSCQKECFNETQISFPWKSTIHVGGDFVNRASEYEHDELIDEVGS